MFLRQPVTWNLVQKYELESCFDCCLKNSCLIHLVCFFCFLWLNYVVENYTEMDFCPEQGDSWQGQNICQWNSFFKHFLVFYILRWYPASFYSIIFPFLVYDYIILLNMFRASQLSGSLRLHEIVLWCTAWSYILSDSLIYISNNVSLIFHNMSILASLHYKTNPDNNLQQKWVVGYSAWYWPLYYVC